MNRLFFLNLLHKYGLVLIFITFLFLRFYKMEVLNPFGWDQVDNAWAAQNMIVNHKFPLLGMVAKQNSGIFIGPIYYYLIAFFYWIFNLNPIASGVFAGVTSIFTFLVLFYVAKKIFSIEVALIAVFINTVAFYGIVFDRVQWPVNFIPAISILIFYSLYKIATGNSKYILFLAFLLGFSFHIHFTSIFFPVLILFSLPFFPRTKETVRYIFLSIPIFLIFIAPMIIAYVQSVQYGSSVFRYGQTYYHGFHLTRVLQLLNDALIQFEPFFTFTVLKPLKYILLPLFTISYFALKPTRDRFLMVYLMILWFVVPWFVFATYSGEISDYYFSTNRFVALLIIAYLLNKIFSFNNWIPKFILACFLIYYTVFNIGKFFSYSEGGIYQRSQKVFKAIEKGKEIGFQEGVSESYLYYYYMRKKGKEVY